MAAFGHGYPVAGGLSQSAVNDAAGARTPLALVFCSFALALCLMFFTGLLTNLPKAVLAVIVFFWGIKLDDASGLHQIWPGCPGGYLCSVLPPSCRPLTSNLP